MADDRQQLVEELLRERAQYVREGKDELVVEVDQELRRLGAAVYRRDPRRSEE